MYTKAFLRSKCHWKGALIKRGLRFCNVLLFIYLYECLLPAALKQLVQALQAILQILLNFVSLNGTVNIISILLNSNVYSKIIQYFFSKIYTEWMKEKVWIIKITSLRLPNTWWRALHKTWLEIILPVFTSAENS